MGITLIGSSASGAGILSSEQVPPLYFPDRVDLLLFHSVWSWPVILGTAALAGAVSLLTSLAGLPECEIKE